MKNRKEGGGKGGTGGAVSTSRTLFLAIFSEHEPRPETCPESRRHTALCLEGAVQERVTTESEGDRERNQTAVLCRPLGQKVAIARDTERSQTETSWWGSCERGRERDNTQGCRGCQEAGSSCSQGAKRKSCHGRCSRAIEFRYILSKDRK